MGGAQAGQEAEGVGEVGENPYCPVVSPGQGKARGEAGSGLASMNNFRRSGQSGVPLSGKGCGD